MKHKVDDLKSTTLHNSLELTAILKDTFSNEGKNRARQQKNKSSIVYYLYHRHKDEQYALQEAIGAQQNTQFVYFDKNASTNLLSAKGIMKVNGDKTTWLSRFPMWIKVLYGVATTIFLAVFLSFLGITLGGYVELWAKVVLWASGAILALSFAIDIGTFVWVLCTKPTPKVNLDCLYQLNDFAMLKQRDFNYELAANCVYVIAQPIYNMQNDWLWQYFLRYVECKPSNIQLNIVVLKTVTYHIGNKHASKHQKLQQSFHEDQKFWQQKLASNSKSKSHGFINVQGGYLVPLTELEKIQLVEELGIGKKIPNGFLSYTGRDYFYDFADNKYMGLTEYGEEVDKIFDILLRELGIQSLSKDGVRAALSFLSALNLFLGDIKDADIPDRLSSHQKLFDYFCKELRPADPLNSDACQKILVKIWKNFDKMPAVIKRELALLTSNDERVDLPIEAYQNAILCALAVLKSKNDNFDIFEAMEIDINIFWDKILYWYGVNSDSRVDKVCKYWLDIIDYLLQINISCGYFVRNCKLLHTLDELYMESLSLSDNMQLAKFYCSPIVKKAHELNAIVAPRLKIDGNYVDVQQMHFNYLKTLANLGKIKPKQDNVPQYFSLSCNFEYAEISKNIDPIFTKEYYNLLVTSKATSLQKVFKAVYAQCMSACSNYIVLRQFSEPYQDYDLLETIKVAIGNINQRSHLSRVFVDDRDEVRMLACGIMDCDLFYLIYNSTHSNKKLVFDNEINSPAYRFVARVTYVEKNGSHFSDIFNEIVDDAIMRKHNDFIEKYFVNVLNYSMFQGTKKSLVNYLKNSKMSINCAKVSPLTKKDLARFLEVLYGVMLHLPDNPLFANVSNLPCEPEDRKILEYFCHIILNKQPVADKDKQQFIDDCKSFHDEDILYILFVEASELDHSLYSDTGKIGMQLLASSYINKCAFVIQHLDDVPQIERDLLIMFIRSRIQVETENDVLPQNTGVLLYYIAFMQQYAGKITKLDLALEQLCNKILTMERDSLRRNAGYLLYYAYNMIQLIGLTCKIGQVSQVNTEMVDGAILSQWNKLKILVIKDDKIGISKEFVQLLAAICNSHIDITPSDLVGLYNHTIDNLLDLFDLYVVKQHTPNIDDQIILLKELRKQFVMRK